MPLVFVSTSDVGAAHRAALPPSKILFWPYSVSSDRKSFFNFRWWIFFFFSLKKKLEANCFYYINTN